MITVSMTFVRQHEFEPRPTSFLHLVERDGWTLKVYSIVYGHAPLARELYDDGLRRAMTDLPKPAVTEHRPGVGFVIFHQGRGWHYLVLSWWDNENELPQRVYVKPIDASNTPWRPASGSESICVWDLRIIQFERDAYVRHVLGGESPKLDVYVSDHMPANG
jgi:hypothetical protein